MVLVAAFFANAQSTNDSTDTTDFESFQIIVDRNIFNPDRYPQYQYHHEAPVTPTFSLAGTMNYRKGWFAFFNGTSDVYQRALQTGGTIAGYTVTKITFDGVQLQGSGTNIDMKVGWAMRQEGDEWELVAQDEWNGQGGTVEMESPGPTETPAATPAATPASSGAENDVLKQLMERRAQELKSN